MNLTTVSYGKPGQVSSPLRRVMNSWTLLTGVVLVSASCSDSNEPSLLDSGSANGPDASDTPEDAGARDAEVADAQIPVEPEWSYVSAFTLEASCGATNLGSIACWGADYSLNDPPIIVGPPAPDDPAFGVMMQYMEGRAAILCGLSVDNRVFCWGNRDLGLVPLASGESAVAITVNRAVCWLDEDGFGQCRTSDNPDSAGVTEATMPTDIVFEQISLGLRYGCGIRADTRAIECWGDDLFNVAGFEPDGEFLDIATGNTHACAVDVDQNLICWGARDVAASEQKPTEAVTDVVIEGASTCARLAADQRWVCWNRETSATSRKLREETPDRPDIENVSVAGTHACGETPDGWICWGDNSECQLDIPDPATISPP